MRRVCISPAATSGIGWRCCWSSRRRTTPRARCFREVLAGKGSDGDVWTWRTRWAVGLWYPARRPRRLPPAAPSAPARRGASPAAEPRGRRRLRYLVDGGASVLVMAPRRACPVSQAVMKQFGGGYGADDVFKEAAGASWDTWWWQPSLAAEAEEEGPGAGQEGQQERRRPRLRRRGRESKRGRRRRSWRRWWRVMAEVWEVEDGSDALVPPVSGSGKRINRGLALRCPRPVHAGELASTWRLTRQRRWQICKVFRKNGKWRVALGNDGKRLNIP